MIRLFFIALAGLVLLGTQPAARAQTVTSFDADLAPHLLTADRTWAPGLTPDLRLNAEHTGFSTSWFARAQTGGPLLLDADLATEALSVSAALGIARNFFRPSPTPPPPPGAPTVPSPPRTGARDFGRVAAGLGLRYETTQTFEDQTLTGGLQLTYSMRGQSGWARLIPSVHLSAEGALPVRADAREAVDAETNGFVLLRGMASITPGLGAALPPDWLDPLDLHVLVDGRWEGATGSAWRSEGLDTAFYAAATLLYAFRDAVGVVEQLYVRFSDGRVPPTTGADRTWTFGAVVGLPASDSRPGR